MTTYLASRLLQGLFVVVAITTLVFFVVRWTGDPAALLISPNSTQDELRAFRRDLGLDGNLLEQYGRFVQRALGGNFGESFRQRRPALTVVIERFPATAQLAFAASVISVLVGIPLGIWAALVRGSTADRAISFVSLLGQAIPVFWLGLMLILVFSVRLHWLPGSGRGTLLHLVLPAFTLGSYAMARITKVTRSSFIGVLHQDYIRTARAKGVTAPLIVGKHAFKNASIPIVTIAALEIGTFLGGSIITETIFAWPGLGRLLIQSVELRDFPVLIAGVFVFSVLIVLINILVDAAYALLDPQISYR